ncbi:hypothetical protein C8J57DRAFT_1464225 [Mycena rebaudengoi]|nr:hypothetical protein C8J57DRAFT_1464225 [Mycena rebaudengoi]
MRKVIPILADFVGKLNITSYFGSFSLKSYSAYFHSPHRSGIRSTRLGAVYIINYFLRACFKYTRRSEVSSHSSIVFYPPSYCPRRRVVQGFNTLASPFSPPKGFTRGFQVLYIFGDDTRGEQSQFLEP